MTTNPATTTMLDELSKLYVQTARAKGLPERTVVQVHALKNAALPSITLTGDEMSGLLNGAVVIGTVFAWPGIGGLMIQAIERRDFPLVEATLFVIIVVGLNLLVDLSYAVLDPRVRYSWAASHRLPSTRRPCWSRGRGLPTEIGIGWRRTSAHSSATRSP